MALVFGSDQANAALPFPATYTGPIANPAKLRCIYAAADVFALPSRQDNLPNTGVESLACGTPIVGFDIGGLPDLVPNREVGYLAKPFDVGDLAAALSQVLAHQCAQSDDTPSVMSRAARAHAVATFDQAQVSAAYGALYDRLIKAPGQILA